MYGYFLEYSQYSVDYTYNTNLIPQSHICWNIFVYSVFFVNLCYPGNDWT